jgi:hypothetical protein
VSLLAEFLVVRRDHLPGLVEAARPKRRLFGKAKSTFPETLQASGREVDGFEWSGYYFGVLLPYLDEKGVPLMDSEFNEAASALSEAQDATTFIFTPAHKSLLPQLDPEAHDEDELRRYFEAFNEYEDPEAGRAMRDALAALRRHIGELDESSVLLLTVG